MDSEKKLKIIENFVFDKEQQKNFGNNEDIIAIMIKFFENVYNDDTKDIIDNFVNLLQYHAYFKIFQSIKSSTYYLRSFGALTISPSDCDNYTLGHELGHVFLHLIDNTTLPNDFEEIMLKSNHLAPKLEGLTIKLNDKDFTDAKLRTVVEYICNKENKMEDVGPFSDIISSMYQTHGFQTHDNKQLILPFYHTKDYYVKKGIESENEKIDYAVVYDEQFANFFSLYINNRYDTLDCLRKIFGDEWYDLMYQKLLMVKSKIKLAVPNDSELSQLEQTNTINI